MIDQREKEEPITKLDIDVQAAQADFEQTYFNPLEQESPTPKSIQRKTKTPTLRIRSKLLVAAIIVGLICLMSMSASAFEFNIFKLFASWTEDTFQFVSALVTGDDGAESDSVLGEFEAMIDKLHAGAPVPTWAPEGYELTETTEYALTSKYIYMAKLESEQGDIAITITHHAEGTDMYARYSEKENPDAEAFVCGNVTHYVLVNEETATATWVDGNFECVIFGTMTEEDLERMIESIYET